ncbi:MAG: type ISP restriction/modification enzyme, partial [Bacteroidota bacterium]
MSTFLTENFIREVEQLYQYGGSANETSIRGAFQTLLNNYCKQKGFLLIPELAFKKPGATRSVNPDGTVKDALRQDWGYWESKDESDDIDEEIQKKFSKGYPDDNIIFEDSRTAVLIQHGAEVQRVPMRDADLLDKLLTQFISYERPEVRNFRAAIELFKSDIPKVLDELRRQIDIASAENDVFKNARAEFLKLCREAINPEISPDDVREMLIQHILTEDIFNVIFDEADFHRDNNIAAELFRLENTFLKGEKKRNLLGALQPYYLAINATAASIADHHEKQKFLKVVYENFYKAYNPKAADRLGIVYTPQEIVRFMIESTDWLLHRHFGRMLGDKNVEILDPATGTGTFICDIIDYLSRERLEHKYRHELHANEVAILPYYIANLNIEATYRQKMGKYAAFENICFVDTLDNMGFGFKNKQDDLFSFAAENTERIKRQNDRKISVIIGNPPYNANQANENDNNKNREYPAIDKRIKDTYIKQSTAQKTKLYDMYARFFRWAGDRISDDGIVCMVTNRSFINSRTFDGFRKIMAEEFDEVYIMDLGGDVRENTKLSGSKNNVFGIQTGVAISFWIKNRAALKTEAFKNGSFKNIAKIWYARLEELATADEKLQFLGGKKIGDISFEKITPDPKNNWINLSDNDFENLIPVASKEVKNQNNLLEEKAIFKTLSLGIATNRDEWVYDFNKENLKNKIEFFFEVFESERKRFKKSGDKIAVNDFVDRKIKWTSELETFLLKGGKFSFDKKKIREASYRPFLKEFVYYDKKIIHRLYQQHNIIPIDFKVENKQICFLAIASEKSLYCLATDKIPDLHFTGDSQCLPLYRYTDSGERMDNITDWALKEFCAHYAAEDITREDIFHYVYAVLHSPHYRTKYALNLRREFPRIPFLKDFRQWAEWGEALMQLHIGYEAVEEFDLKVVSTGNPPVSPLVRGTRGERSVLFADDDNQVLSPLSRGTKGDSTPTGNPPVSPLVRGTREGKGDALFASEDTAQEILSPLSRGTKGDS